MAAQRRRKKKKKKTGKLFDELSEEALSNPSLSDLQGRPYRLEVQALDSHGN